jgi:hypothetical protein
MTAPTTALGANPVELNLSPNIFNIGLQIRGQALHFTCQM